MTQRLRAVGLLLVKLGVAAGILGWLLSRMDVSRVGRAVLEARGSEVSVALVLMLLTLPVVGWRWQRLLRVYGVDLPVPLLMATVHVGQLFGLILPGSLGEDLVRTTSIARLSGKRTSIVLASVLADRIAALLGLLFLALVAMPVHWSLLQNGGVQTRLLSFGMLGAAGAAILGTCTVAWVPVSRLRALVQPLVSRLPGAGRVNDWFTTVETLVRSQGVFRELMGGALLTQLLLCGVYYFCGRAVGVHAPVQQWLGFVPIILAANVVPVTVAGIGVREYLLVLFLGVVAQVDETQAMAVSLLVLAVSLLQCLSGVLSYLWFQPRSMAAYRKRVNVQGQTSSGSSGDAKIPAGAVAEDAATGVRAAWDRSVGG
jgi:uncharacterized membrane protein YbhN (UPF0104 family)